MIAFRYIIFPYPSCQSITAPILDLTPAPQTKNKFTEEQAKRSHGIASLPDVTLFLQEQPRNGSCFGVRSRMFHQLMQIVRGDFHIVVTKEYPLRFRSSDTDIALDTHRSLTMEIIYLQRRKTRKVLSGKSVLTRVYDNHGHNRIGGDSQIGQQG